MYTLLCTVPGPVLQDAATPGWDKKCTCVPSALAVQDRAPGAGRPSYTNPVAVCTCFERTVSKCLSR